MNYYRLLFLVFLMGITQLTSAQKKVLLKMSMAPNKTYKTLMNNVLNMEMMVKGDSAVLARLDASGMKLPIQMHIAQDMAITTKTSAQREDKKIPVTMTYDKLSSTMSVGDQAPIQSVIPFSNAVIEGTTMGDGKISIDTIKGDLDDAMKTAVRQMVNNMQLNYKFPEKELKIGDSFDQEVPMNIPIPQAQMKMKLVTTFTLKEIRDKKAIFDMKQAINMVMDMPQNTDQGTGAGSGTGVMIYDMKKEIAEQSNSDLQFHFEFVISGLTMSASCKGKTSITYQVE